MTFDDRSLVEQLNLDVDLLQRAAIVNEGFGTLYLRAAEDAVEGDNLILAASCFVFAADYYALIRPPQSGPLFRQAAAQYRRLGHPFSVVLAVCGNDQSEVGARVEALAQDRSQDTDPDVAMENLVAGMAFAAVRPERYGVGMLGQVLERTGRVSHHATGRLGVPAHVYQAMGRAMQLVARTRESGAVRDPVQQYLRRTADSVGAAMADDFHWRRLQSALLPVEPEAIATCVAWDLMCRRMFQESLPSVMDGSDLTPREMAPAVVAAKLNQSSPPPNQQRSRR